jgi:UDP-N-acetylmuramate--alanine ligase
MKHKSVYLIGIGGIGLSALARYFLSENWSVEGSDMVKSPLINDLEAEGAIIHIGHKAKHVKDLKNTMIVYSKAVKHSNPEMKQALNMGLKCKSYPQVVGELTKKYKTIALAGSHGKSTTTSILSLILIETGIDPTVIVGTKLKEFGNSNFRKGKSNYLILEADEYAGAFWNYYPFISGIINIDREHLDFYKNFDGVKKSFRKFLTNHKNKSKVIFNNFDNNLKDIVNSVKKIKPIPVSIDDKEIQKIKKVFKIAGKHNLLDAFIAYSVAKQLNIPEKKILKAIGNYQGVWRRMEFKGNLKIPSIKQKVLFFDDYAHHPKEIMATLEGLREKYPKNALVCIFQPHQAQRLRVLFSDFKIAFKEADKIILLPIYEVAGRERKLNTKYSSKSLSKFIKNSMYVDNPKKNLALTLKSVIGSFKSPIIIVAMGAGDIIDYSQALLTKYK